MLTPFHLAAGAAGEEDDYMAKALRAMVVGIILAAIAALNGCGPSYESRLHTYQMEKAELESLQAKYMEMDKLISQISDKEKAREARDRLIGWSATITKQRAKVEQAKKALGK